MREWFKRYFGLKQNITAVAVTCLAAAIVCFVLFVGERPGEIDYGQYDRTLNAVGLSRTQNDLDNPNERYFTKVIEEYSVETIKLDSVFQFPPSKSLIYPVTVISIICKVFGINFSTFYLAILLTVVMLWAVYTCVKAVYPFLKGYTALVGILLCFTTLCGSYLVPFGTLYNNGMFLVSLWLFMAAVLKRAVTIKEKRGVRDNLPLLFCAMLLLNSTNNSLLMLPLVGGIAVYFIWKSRPVRDKPFSHFCILGVLLIGVCASNIGLAAQNQELFSKENLYQSVFNGALPAAKDKTDALRQFGLEDGFAGDIGKSAYLSDDQYFVSPHSATDSSRIYSHISYPAVAGYYLHNPETFYNSLNKAVASLEKVDTSKYLYVGQKAQQHAAIVEKFYYWQLVRALFTPNSFAGYLIIFAIGLAVALFELIKNKSKAAAVYMGMILSFIALLVGTVFICGNTDIGDNGFDLMLLYDLFLCFSAVYLIKRAYSIYCYIIYFGTEERRKVTTAEGEEEYQRLPAPWFVFAANKLSAGFRVICSKVSAFGRVPLIFTAIAAVIMVLVLFVPRIGAFSNGDLGRVMESMNLTYVEKDGAGGTINPIAEVIENYKWIELFDWAKMNPSRLYLGQGYISVLFYLLHLLTGINYSTAVTAAIYLLILGISYYVIIKTLSPFFKKYTVLFASLLIVILFGSTNMVWLNSLYGEGVAFVSLVSLVAASCLVLSKMKGTGIIGFVWLLLSVFGFVTAKAQYTIELAILAVWVVALAIYRMPKKITLRMVTCVLIIVTLGVSAVSALSIYQHNDEISSPDTIYHGLFYGILMISEDPKATLRELGLDESLAADTGKHAYLDKSQYFCPPRSEKAEQMVYSKVSTFDFLKYYLRHPDKLYYMLNVASKASSDSIPDFFLYVGEKETETHHIVSKFDLWQSLRKLVTPTMFWQYLLFYGVLMVWSLKRIFSKKAEKAVKPFLWLYLVIMAIGIIQFPLTVIGNGFADNVKQLYIFRITYDLTVFVALFLLCGAVKKLNEVIANRLSRKDNLLLHTDEELQHQELTCSMEEEV